MLKNKLIFNAVSLALLGCVSTTANANQVQSFQYSSQSNYKISAADVFRLRKNYPDLALTKALRPIFSTLYYSEAQFKQALIKQLGDENVNKVYQDLKPLATLPPLYLNLSVLTDNTFQLSYRNDATEPLSHSELLDLTRLPPVKTLATKVNGFTTNKMTVNVDPMSLCVSVEDKQQTLNQICPDAASAFTVQASDEYRLSGLGQEFQHPGIINGDWNGKVRHSGNQMEGFNGGATGNTLFPILYATSPELTDFSIYLDNMYSTQWDFTRTPWQVRSSQGDVNMLVSLSENQAQLRDTYMTMVGKPLVPPRKMFGMWLSEYGFDNWQELDDKLATLKNGDFPIDGVVMDLQWFGNVEGNDPMSQMGTLTWDRKHFPQPEEKIKALKKQGVGMMLIEESYVSSGLDEHKIMEQSGYLAQDPTTGKAINARSDGGGSWWGKGGMIDWTNLEGATKWHDWKRAPLIDMGIMGHWTDLGEPEIYNSNGVYANGKAHADIHNWFNYKWIESIYAGYQRHGTEQRPFMMSRSGAPGIQRFGASMWSGDIGSNLTSLAVHIAMQNNMMLSGIDYYGSDIGGFHRKGLGVSKQEKPAVLKETYTQRFAYSSLFDVPVRPHTENLCNCKETAPDRIGDKASNKANIELRYQLIPYLYSNAHQAHIHGKPVFPSLAYQYPNDVNAQALHNHKMLGESLLSVGVAKLGQRETNVYLPAGKWFDYRTGQGYQSKAGTELKHQSLYTSKEGATRYQLPLFAKEGAIVPFNPNSELTSEVPNTIALKVFGLPTHSDFTLYEDDGETTNYLNGELRKTEIQVNSTANNAELSFVTTGSYLNAPTKRPLLIEWYLSGQQVHRISLDGKLIKGWTQDNGRLLVEIDPLDVRSAYSIIVEFE
ncbi:TIM-barrel domain-containing protein [Vibrio tapetis]|uniref:Alpha-glucosidase n=1 Tax=Vibrio tapetis subsp. tapetis TaxID=1671868 RepID=A0A2N8ZAF2_9VIBR|nr:TIM-barrel domain-containing protein [Vibrio tapetis]SON48881.1 Alpha-glucosidase [Vibrio tapetis subsp. tapetis]